MNAASLVNATAEEINALTADQLKSLAAELNIKGRNRMSKAKLIQAITREGEKMRAEQEAAKAAEALDQIAPQISGQEGKPKSVANAEPRRKSPPTAEEIQAMIDRAQQEDAQSPEGPQPGAVFVDAKTGAEYVILSSFVVEGHLTIRTVSKDTGRQYSVAFQPLVKKILKQLTTTA